MAYISKLVYFLVFTFSVSAFDYSFTDLPSVYQLNSSRCDDNVSVSDSFVASYHLGKVHQNEISSMRAIIYELPKGTPYTVDVKNGTLESGVFQTPALALHRRHLVILGVRLRNATIISDWLWSQEHRFITCTTEERIDECLCDPVGSRNFSGGGGNSNCRVGSQQCVCRTQFTGDDCSVCADGFYRDYANYDQGCLPCQCAVDRFSGPCVWRRVGEKSVAGSGDVPNSSRRRCLGCAPGYDGELCEANGMGLSAQVALGIGCLLGIMLFIATVLALRQHCHRRALRAARHSLAVQRLFSRFKDDTSLDAETSAILAEDDALQRATQQLRLGSDPVYQPTTISIS